MQSTLKTEYELLFELECAEHLTVWLGRCKQSEQSPIVYLNKLASEPKRITLGKLAVTASEYKIKKGRCLIMTIFTYYFHFTNEDVKLVHDEIDKFNIKEWLQEYKINFVTTTHGFFIKSNKMLFMQECVSGLSLGIYKEPYSTNDMWDIGAIPEDISIYTHVK